ncbi:MAG: peroxidase family protein [Candidatus Obscuribacterales bacterium]
MHTLFIVMGLAALLLVVVLNIRGMMRNARRKAMRGMSRCPFHRSPPAGNTGDPGLGWQERYLDGSPADEHDFIVGAVAEINEVQRNNQNASGDPCVRRAFHAKIHAGIENAEFEVAADIPEALRVGIFMPGKKYRTAIRFSNASGKIQPDSKKDLRGIACRLATELGDHDLLATNGSASHARDVRQFIAFASAMSGNKLLILPRLIWSVGFFETVRMFRTVIKQGSRKVDSLATESYFSRSAYAFGDVALAWRLVPSGNQPAGVALSDGYLRADLVELLRRGPVAFDFQIQLYADESRTPIEDGSVEWDTQLVTIARLTIPRQDLESAEAVASREAVEDMEFNPWHVTDGIRPLGSQNRGRKPVYMSSVAFRKQGKADPGPFRPKSSRQGIGPVKYVYWNAFYFVLQSLNRGLARNPYNKVSWDKWPPVIGLLYLLAKIRFNRSNALTDPYDYATNDTRSFGCEPEAARHQIDPDGTYVSDREDPQMGARDTRFGSNIPPRRVRPDVEAMSPSAREVGKIRWRRIDPETGREITIPALILNDLAGWWIQFQFHGFGGNTRRDPVSQCPHMLARTREDDWPGDVALVDRTTADYTRLTDNGRATPLNERVQAWIQGQLYGTDEEELKTLRSFEGGKFRLDANGNLPEDPDHPGIDLTGFNNNFGPGLSFLHWLFVVEHNAIADYYASFHPDWNDEELFRQAAKVNIAQIARIHTIIWTEDLLQHPTLQLGMHADWYGFLGQKTKMFLMRLCHRSRFWDTVLRPLRHNDVLWGMPGSKWEHHDGPFQVPKQFRMVYRLHEMVLSEHEIIDPKTNRTIDRIALMDFVHNNTRAVVEKFGYEVLAWSFVKKSAGALTAHNVARAFTRFHNQLDGTLTDLPERDAFRERTDGTGTFNEFRQSLGEPPVTSFLELTGGDAELARELEIKFEGDVNLVDAGIGIIAEPKPAGFALGYCQFYQFVLNAPRRVKSNRHLTEGFTYAEYQEGMNWVEHSGGMLGVMARHLPGLRPNMEGVERAFAPWPETETFPQRQLTRTHSDTAKVFQADLRTFIIALVAGGFGIATGVVGVKLVGVLLAALVAAPLALVVRRMLAMRYMQQVWQKCYTDRRRSMFSVLLSAERSIERAARFGRLHALGVLLVMTALAIVGFHTGHGILGFLTLAVAASSISTYKWSSAFANDAQVLKISLRNRMREGVPFKTFSTLTSSGVARQKRAVFDGHMPASLRTVEERLYKGAGEVDMEAFDLMFRTYAPGRDYMTAYDFARKAEGDRLREGRKGLVSGFLSALSSRRRVRELLFHFADVVANEDKKLVPAISRERLLGFLDGSAHAEILEEKR